MLHAVIFAAMYMHLCTTSKVLQIVLWHLTIILKGECYGELIHWYGLRRKQLCKCNHSV